MPESAAELEQLKADGELSVLLERRVRRWFLHDDHDDIGAWYNGTVHSLATKTSKLVNVLWDVDGTEEELDAEQLAECLCDPDEVVPDQILWPKAIRSPPKKQDRTGGRPSTAPTNLVGPGPCYRGPTNPRMTTTASASTGTAREMATTPKANKRKADVDGPRPPRCPVGGVSPDGKNKGGRPSTSPVKRYLGTTQESSGLWRAQLVVRGKYYSQSGFATEEEAALAWNRLAKMHGRSDYNVLPAMPDPSAGGAAPKRTKVAHGAAEGPAAKPQRQGPESRGSWCMIM